MQILSVFRLMLLIFVCFAGVAPAENRTFIILDGSGSMWGQIDGRPKLDLAREALSEVLQSVPTDTELGLIAYGHRSKGDCSDIETLVAPAANTADAISAAADKMQFLGKTPLTDAVRKAAAELRSTEDKATVVLITDGIETCKGDPCALGRELEASGVDFTAHVVGFGLTAEEGKQVACLAEETGGKYIVANDLDSLKDALQNTVVASESAPSPPPPPPPAPAPVKLDYNFAPTAMMAADTPFPADHADVVWELYDIRSNGDLGDRVTTQYNDPQSYIEPGHYRLIARIGSAQVSQDITLSADRLSAPQLILNAAELILRPVGVDAGPTLDAASVTLRNGKDLNTTSYGQSRFYVAAGEIEAIGAMGAAEATQRFTLKPGDQIRQDLLIGSGLVAVEAYYVDGMKMEDTSHSVSIFAAKKKIDGSQDRFGTTYGQDAQFTLPPGDYIAVIEMNSATAEMPFSIKIGERTDVAVILNAGVLYVSAPGASQIEVFKAKPDLTGDRKKLSFDYNQEVTTTVSAGDVLIRAKLGDKIVEQTATVKAGERTEATLNMQ